VRELKRLGSISDGGFSIDSESHFGDACSDQNVQFLLRKRKAEDEINGFKEKKVASNYCTLCRTLIFNYFTQLWRKRF
jgi:hypothetical protein